MDFSFLAGKTNLRIWLCSSLLIEFTKRVSGVTCTLGFEGGVKKKKHPKNHW